MDLGKDTAYILQGIGAVIFSSLPENVSVSWQEIL